MAKFTDYSIKALTKKLSAFLNVKLRKPVLMSTGSVQIVSDDRKAFFDEQFIIIMKRIKESYS